MPQISWWPNYDKFSGADSPLKRFLEGVNGSQWNGFPFHSKDTRFDLCFFCMLVFVWFISNNFSRVIFMSCLFASHLLSTLRVLFSMSSMFHHFWRSNKTWLFEKVRLFIRIQFWPIWGTNSWVNFLTEPWSWGKHKNSRICHHNLPFVIGTIHIFSVITNVCVAASLTLVSKITRIRFWNKYGHVTLRHLCAITADFFVKWE